MGHRVEQLAVAAPGVRAARSTGTERYIGVKDAFMITRLERGSARMWTHGRVWDAAPGTVVLHQPGEVHRDVERHGEVVLQIVRLPADEMEALTDEVRLAPILDPGDPRAAPFHRLHDAIAAGADRLEIDCALTEAIAAFGARDESRRAHSQPVRRALALIRERIGETITLDELATHARLDKFHLCRAFRAQVGMPPHAYLTQLRIMHAKEMLAAGAKPKDIAARVGLYDQSQLNRHFRRIVGMTPGQFARNS